MAILGGDWTFHHFFVQAGEMMNIGPNVLQCHTVRMGDRREEKYEHSQGIVIRRWVVQLHSDVVRSRK
jgi:hypothetical protein